jgi:hypothetical protein
MEDSPGLSMSTEKDLLTRKDDAPIEVWRPGGTRRRVNH